MKRKLSGFESLEKELKREISFIRYDTVATKDHTYFLDQSAKLFAHLLSNKKTLQSNSTQIITHLMDTLVEKNNDDISTFQSFNVPPFNIPLCGVIESNSHQNSGTPTSQLGTQLNTMASNQLDESLDHDLEG